jgi:hypothetical protein
MELARGVPLPYRAKLKLAPQEPVFVEAAPE